MDTESLPMRILKASRYLWSFLIVGFSGFIIIYGILANESGFNRTFPNCPPPAALVIFFALILFFGLLEGGHVCVVDLSKHSTETFKQKYKMAASTHKYVSGPNIFNLSKYLMGRQVMVILNQFFLGSLASFPGMVNFPFTDKPFPDLFKKIMVDTGLLNVVFVTTFGSLVPQLIATRYPVQFMNILGIRVIVFAGLIIEASGVAHFSWVLHDILTKYVFRMDHSVTKQVMADTCEEAQMDTLEIDSRNLSEDFWTTPMPSMKTETGHWKDTNTIAQEWQNRGSKIPNSFSAVNHVPQQEVIKQLLNLVKRDAQLAAIAQDIVFVN